MTQELVVDTELIELAKAALAGRITDPARSAWILHRAAEHCGALEWACYWGVVALDRAAERENREGERRAFATMNAANMTREALQALMRHQSSLTTERYINFARQMAPAVANLQFRKCSNSTRFPRNRVGTAVFATQ
jgi:hypothetical protein